jgi:N-acetylglucosaminyldiphosphoundecaprenol N-acetyl-beta-D-mannosaminyltransferase
VPAEFSPPAVSDDSLRFDVLGVEFCYVPTRELIDRISQAALQREGLSVYIPNAHTLNLAYERPDYRELLGRGSIVVNDGVGVRIAARRAGIRSLENQNGTDLTPAICRAGSRHGLRVYWLGGVDGQAAAASKELERRCPGIKIVGTHHGYFSEVENAAICAEIRACRPHLLLVSFGNPLQEEWIDAHLDQLDGAVAIGVGGLVDHLAGDLVRAPKIMQRLGLEWVHRLIQQPRVWRRYVLGIPRFLWRINRHPPSIISRPAASADPIPHRSARAAGRWYAKSLLRGAIAATGTVGSKLTSTHETHDVRVLMYHRVDDDPTDAFSIPPDRFRAQMGYLSRHCEVLDLDRYDQFLRGELDLSKPGVLITFDDGYLSVLRHGLPALRAHGLPAVLFASTKDIDEVDPTASGDRHLTWDEVRELHAGGITIASHGWSHRALASLSPEQQQIELERSRALLAQHVPGAADAYAYPFGVAGTFDDLTEDHVAAAGFAYSFRAQHGRVRPGDFRLAARIKADQSDPTWVFGPSTRGALDGWSLVDRVGARFQHGGLAQTTDPAACES